MLKQLCGTAGLTVLLVIAAALPLQATDTSENVYLSMTPAQSEALIGPPPARDSAEHKTQMDIVLWLQKTRTPEQVAFVEKTLSLERFAPIIAEALIDVDGLELKNTFAAILSEVQSDYDTVKAVYGEPRPFQINDAVKPVGDARPVASYPSGHAIRATVYASLLSEIFPDHKDALMDLAEQIGYGRVIAGVHYPIDVTAGQKLGGAYASDIAAQPAFKAAVEKIKGE